MWSLSSSFFNFILSLFPFIINEMKKKFCSFNPLILLLLIWNISDTQWLCNVNRKKSPNHEIILRSILNMTNDHGLCSICIISYIFFYPLFSMRFNDKFFFLLLRLNLIDSNIIHSNHITCTCDKDWNVKRNIIFVFNFFLFSFSFIRFCCLISSQIEIDSRNIPRNIRLKKQK